MRTALVNHSDLSGGAARAAYRIHHALRLHGVESAMYVNDAVSRDESVIGPAGKRDRALAKFRSSLGTFVQQRLKTENSVLHSPAIVPSAWSKRIDAKVDLVHLHWINNEMMSVRDIGRLNEPVVWTLHDMWAFCGAEHYTEEFRWQVGYSHGNRPLYESGFDLNRWTWRRKVHRWQHPLHIVTPSTWLADCVRNSALMHDWPVSVIPNAINTDVWQPIDKAVARELLHLPQDVPLLLFGAMGGVRDPRKGFDLLKSALANLIGEIGGLELAIFGQREPKESPNLGFKTHYTGHLSDDVSLRLLYSAADAIVIPSRQDNLPNTGLESMACGTPVIAFDTGGLSDIVEHKTTGYLASPFDTADLAAGIRWVLDTRRQESLGQFARSCAVSRWSYQVVAPQYLDVYRQAVASYS